MIQVLQLSHLAGSGHGHQHRRQPQAPHRTLRDQPPQKGPHGVRRGRGVTRGVGDGASVLLNDEKNGWKMGEIS